MSVEKFLKQLEHDPQRAENAWNNLLSEERLKVIAFVKSRCYNYLARNQSVEVVEFMMSKLSPESQEEAVKGYYLGVHTGFYNMCRIEIVPEIDALFFAYSRKLSSDEKNKNDLLEMPEQERLQQFGTTDIGKIIAKVKEIDQTVFDDVRYSIANYNDVKFQKNILRNQYDYNFGRKNKEDKANIGNGIIALRTILSLAYQNDDTQMSSMWSCFNFILEKTGLKTPKDDEDNSKKLPLDVVHKIFGHVMKDLGYNGDKSDKWADRIISKRQNDFFRISTLRYQK
jgi:hypothetical protein